MYLNNTTMTSITQGTSIPATSPEDLRKQLRQGPVRFAFRKKDGSLRIAYGTLDLSKIPADAQPKGNPAPEAILPYYDLDKFAWRSISIGQLIFG